MAGSAHVNGMNALRTYLIVSIIRELFTTTQCAVIVGHSDNLNER